MKTYFCFQDYWNVVEEGYTTPADTSALIAAQKKELKESKLKDSKALFTLQQAVTDTIFPRILGAKSEKKLGYVKGGVPRYMPSNYRL